MHRTSWRSAMFIPRTTGRGVTARAGLSGASTISMKPHRWLRAMGFDLAAIHAAHSKAAKIKADLKTRPRDWLTTASEKAAEGFGVTSRGGRHRSAVLRTVARALRSSCLARNYNRSSTIYYKDWIW